WKAEPTEWLEPKLSTGGSGRIVCDLSRDFDAPRQLGPTGRWGHKMIRGGHNQAVLYESEQVAAKNGIELRHPFFNRNLVDFLMHAPYYLLGSVAFDRLILRRS